jgi:toxin ParE1/3/4
MQRMYKIIFHPDIQAELQIAYDWYDGKLSGLGEELLNELDIAFISVVAKPTIWPVFAKGYRRYLLKRFPFGIIYKIDKKNIYVVAVMHLSREPGYWKRRHNKKD